MKPLLSSHVTVVEFLYNRQLSKPVTSAIELYPEMYCPQDLIIQTLFHGTSRRFCSRRASWLHFTSPSRNLICTESDPNLEG